MKIVDATITNNTRLNAAGYYEMTLFLPVPDGVKSGRFLNIAVPGKYLRRPFGICDYSDSGITVLYKVVGEGTALMAGMKAGESVNIMLPLGNGFDLSAVSPALNVAVVGGGAGLAPLFALVKELNGANIKPHVIMGFTSAADAFYIDQFRALDAMVTVVTVDGSLGIKGYPTDIVQELSPDYGFVCGPPAMLDAYLRTGIDGQLSYESRMGCGFGACVGCSKQTAEGHKRICTDGPVFFANSVRIPCGNREGGI